MQRLRQKRPEFDSVGRLLKGYGANAASVARVLHCAPTTAKKKLTEPKYMTIENLLQLSVAYGIPFAEIRDSIVR